MFTLNTSNLVSLSQTSISPPTCLSDAIGEMSGYMRPPLDGCDPDNSLLSAHVLTKLCFSNFTELCNSADPEFREYLINNDGIDLTIKALTR